MDKADATKVARREKTGHVSHDTTAKRDDERTTLDPMFGKFVVTGADGVETLRRLAGRHTNFDRIESGIAHRSQHRFGINRPDFAIGDNSTAATELEPATFVAESREEFVTNFDGVAAIPEGHFDRAHAGEDTDVLPSAKAEN